MHIFYFCEAKGLHRIVLTQKQSVRQTRVDSETVRPVVGKIIIHNAVVSSTDVMWSFCSF